MCGTWYNIIIQLPIFAGSLWRNVWRIRNQNYQVPLEKWSDPKWTRCRHVLAFEEMKTVFVPLKRNKEELSSESTDMYIFAFLISEWPLQDLVQAFSSNQFFKEKACVAFLSLFIYFYLYSNASVKNQHNLYFAVKLHWNGRITVDTKI